jgi:hypothetical protein
LKEEAQKVKLLKPFDVNNISIEKDHYFSGAYIIDLPLESSPGHIWLDIFEREWRSSRHLWDRKLFIIDSKIRLVTTEHEFKEKLDWIEQVIDQTNKAVEQYNRKTQMAKQQRRQLTWEEKARIERLRETLRRVFGSV